MEKSLNAEISDSITFEETGIKVILYMNGDVKQIDIESGNLIEWRRKFPDLTTASNYFLKVCKANEP